jgi:uncharacterized protein (DUF305 family)
MRPRAAAESVTTRIVATLLVALSSTFGAAQGERGSTPLFTADDLLFLQHMIVHHEQAVVMSLLVPARTDRDQFIRFARYVARAQAAEIELMRSLLELAADRGMDVPDYHPHGDPPMAGMLSNAEIEAIAAASGAEFERLWLTGMIYHHQGALDMASEQQREQLETGRRPYEIAVLVEDILVEQRAEITQMRAWLAEWGLASARHRAWMRRADRHTATIVTICSRPTKSAGLRV